MMSAALSLMVLAAIGLVLGAVALWRRGDAGSRKKAALMLALAVIMAGNVAIWTLPDPAGKTPLDAPAR